MIKDIWSKVSYYWFVGMLLIVGLLCGGLEVNAEEIGIYAPFDGYSGSSVCDDNGHYNYDKNGPNVQGRIAYAIGNVNSTVSGRAKNFLLFFKKDLEAGKTYDVTIYFNNYDLMNNVTSSKVYLYSTTTCSSYSVTNQLLSLMSVSNKATSSQNSNKIKLRIYAGELIGNWAVEIKGGTSNITSVSNFGIKSVDLKEVDTSGNNAIINNNTQNTENIINNNNENTQEIINNQNQNTQAQIDSQKVCDIIDKSSIVTDGWITSAGTINPNSNYGITDYIKITENDDLTLLNTLGYNIYFCFYNVNKTQISCNTDNNFSVNDSIPIPTNTSYVRFSILKSLDKPTFKICKGGNQAITDSISDDNVDDPSEMLEDFEDLLPSNGVITQLIALPLSLYNKILSNINGTCSAFSLGELYETNLIIPCIDISQYLGNTIWTTIDVIVSGAFVLVIAKKMIRAFENFTSMKDGDVINND